LDPIQNSFELHPGFFSCWICAWQSYPIQDLSQDALLQSASPPRADLPVFFKAAFKEENPSRACGKCGIFHQAINHVVFTHKFH
jgi:hypothetical protein